MKCPYCKSGDTIGYFKTELPNIVAACPEDMIGKVRIFPFEARLCMKCMLGYSSRRLNDEELGAIYDKYLYISPGSGIGCTKYEGMLGYLRKYYSKTDKIVEIGCSEGYLLNHLKNDGFVDLTGIEPAPQAEQARELGLNVMREYFNDRTFPDGSVDGFYLMHVFEHFTDPFSVMDAMNEQLSPNGKIVIEVPDFGGYHHQHIFFYNLAFLKRLCDDKGLKIVEFDTSMSAIRAVMAHKGNETYEEAIISETRDEVVRKAEGIYDGWARKVKSLNELLGSSRGKKVYIWGGGSMAVIFINQIDPEIRKRIDITVVDADKNKWGCLIPGTDIRVRPYNVIKESKVDTLVIASSFYNEIVGTMRSNRISAERLYVL